MQKADLIDRLKLITFDQLLAVNKNPAKTHVV